MKGDYITLASGRQVRIMFNMNALEEFTNITGKELADYANNKADIATLKTIAWCSAREGELTDGRELGLSETELGREMTMAAIKEFATVFYSQCANSEQKKTRHGRSPLIMFRRRG